MANITEYSDIQQKAIQEIVNLDNGFHTSYMIADLPLYAMLEELDNGQYSVKEDVTCSMSTGGSTYNLNIWYSQSQKCWFYLLSYLGEEIRGIVHYNTVLNAKGELSFAILNDNTDDRDMSNSLPYSNILVMRK